MVVKFGKMEKEDEKIKEDLSKFLDKVDQIGELVKDLATSTDQTSSSKALEKADQYIKKESKRTTTTSVDRTIVNTSTTPHSSTEGGVGAGGEEGSTQTAFLRSLEEDARERGERRREREVRGKEAKRKGIKAFRESNFEQTVDCFTSAVKEMPWDITLYTNRAATYNKMTRYSEAIEDCDKALRFEPNTLKAYIHKGNALKGLEDFQKAKECFAEALRLFPEHAKQIAPYLQDLEPPAVTRTTEQ